MARDCGGLVSDNLSRNEVRETTRFEHRHRAVAQTVERNLAWLACCGVTFAGAFARARFNQTSVHENLSELMRQVTRTHRACRIWKDESVGIITRWQPAQIVTERLHERQHDAPSRLARRERNLAGGQIDRAPRQFC